MLPVNQGPSLPVLPRQPEAGTPSDAAAPQSFSDRAKMLEDLTAQAIEGSKPQDVEALSARHAKARYQQIAAMQAVGAFQYMGVNATYKGEKTSSLDTYMGWLEQRFSPGAAEEADAPTPSSDLPAKADAMDPSPVSSLEVVAEAPLRGSAYASIVRAQAATEAAGQVVTELGKLAARVKASDKPVDVDALSPETARSQHEQLTALQRLGGPLLNLGLAAVFGDQNADMSKLVALLIGGGADQSQGYAAVPPSLMDFRA